MSSTSEDAVRALHAAGFQPLAVDGIEQWWSRRKPRIGTQLGGGDVLIVPVVVFTRTTDSGCDARIELQRPQTVILAGMSLLIFGFIGCLLVFRCGQSLVHHGFNWPATIFGMLAAAFTAMIVFYTIRLAFELASDLRAARTVMCKLPLTPHTAKPGNA